MSGYSKLDCGIIHSSVWQEPHDVRVAWITMLGLTDYHGHVRAAIPALANINGVTVQRMEEILEIFMSPDPYSRTPDNDGRRLMRAENGDWVVLNYPKYRDGLKQSDRTSAERKARQREREREEMSRQKRDSHGMSRSGTASHAYSDSDSDSEAKKENPTDSCPKPDSPAPGQQQSALKEKESSPPNPDDPVVMVFPVKDALNKQWGLRRSKASEWKQTFGTAVDVASELKKARQWLLDNPDRQKTPRGMVKFLGSWLQKGNNTGRSIQRGGYSSSNEDLPEYIRDAMKAAGKL